MRSGWDVWRQRPIPELIQHILEHYHAPLDEELPELGRQLREVVVANIATHRAQLTPVLHAFEALKEQLEHHMTREEELLFPAIREGRYEGSDESLQILRMEHESEGWLVERLHKLTDGYTPPAEASEAWRSVWARLAALEASLGEHMALETKVLAPRVLKQA